MKAFILLLFNSNGNVPIYVNYSGKAQKTPTCNHLIIFLPFADYFRFILIQFENLLASYFCFKNTNISENMKIYQKFEEWELSYMFSVLLTGDLAEFVQFDINWWNVKWNSNFLVALLRSKGYIHMTLQDCNNKFDSENPPHCN